MLHVGKPLHLTLHSVDLLKFCSHFRDLDFVYSNFKVIQNLRLTFAFKLVLSHSSQILLTLCNPAIPSLAVSCYLFVLSYPLFLYMSVSIDGPRVD